jgi:hypothetical protein
MLETLGLSKEWWGETILTACHVLNKVPTKIKEITPFEEWEKNKLNMSYCAPVVVLGRRRRRYPSLDAFASLVVPTEARRLAVSTLRLICC